MRIFFLIIKVQYKYKILSRFDYFSILLGIEDLNINNIINFFFVIKFDIIGYKNIIKAEEFKKASVIYNKVFNFFSKYSKSHIRIFIRRFYLGLNNKVFKKYKIYSYYTYLNLNLSKKERFLLLLENKLFFIIYRCWFVVTPYLSKLFIRNWYFRVNNITIYDMDYLCQNNDIISFYGKYFNNLMYVFNSNYFNKNLIYYNVSYNCILNEAYIHYSYNKRFYNSTFKNLLI